MSTLADRTPAIRYASMILVTLLATTTAACHRQPPSRSIEPAASEQVNFGYGMEARRYSTSRIDAVAGAEVSAGKVSQVEELLIGRFPGVQVMPTPGGGFAVRIRGFSTLMGDSEPLYVVDGMPVQVTRGRGIDWLSPGDIARIDLLKDAASTAMYGMRGSNGVVLITTRRAR